MSVELEDLEFLIRSNQRVAVLQRLAVSPCVRHDLHSELGIPQSTLGRILGDFQERVWIRRDADVYELTLLGEILVTELSSMLDAMGVVHQLTDIIDLLPVAEMEFDHRCLKEASITTATADGVTVVIHRMVRMVQSADTLRLITHVGYDTALEDHRRAVVERNQDLEVVLTRAALDEFLSDPAQSRLLLEILESGRADIYSFDGAFPYVMGIGDEHHVGIGAVDERGIPVGFVQTDDKSVRRWVRDTIDRYRTEATVVSVSLVENSLP
ncbi:MULTISPECIES: winged helix-turn-helix domain-containing protein [Haloferax]|uniref:DNA binding protein n=1 Tax=Haloferax marinum TaxID=2666143 RepID=A0A6A8G454_9EURY|nr:MULTISPECIES: hypothetical protein [Haloferax]KAB1196572.1 hypothetical protein Hfx1150_03180 [Haloferax sp. CBA1150]MRW95575.1 hypothetical protein [Haloferax marinum]